jgi:hypothetical protein
MPDIHQVWEGHDGWKALGLRYYVHQDFEKQGNIENSFDFVTSARVFGPQIGSVTVSPLANKKINLNATLGLISGEINDWQGYKNGQKSAWDAGGLTEARFLLVLDIDITVHLFGKVVVKGFHKPCTVLLHWDAEQNKYVYLPPK